MTDAVLLAKETPPSMCRIEYSERMAPVDASRVEYQYSQQMTGPKCEQMKN